MLQTTEGLATEYSEREHEFTFAKSYSARSLVIIQQLHKLRLASHLCCAYTLQTVHLSYHKYCLSPYLLTRNSSSDEIANVNFLYDGIAHALQNTINSCMNSSTDRRGYVFEHRFTKFSETTQCNGHYAVQRHSRS